MTAFEEWTKSPLFNVASLDFI